MKLWFSLYDRNNYEGNEPSFFETSQIEFTHLIEKSYPIIREELENYLRTKKLQDYFNKSMVEEFGTWKTISLKWWGINFNENYKYFPQTLSIINSIDGLVSASFNKLEPNGKIKPHCGDTNTVYRCHLGLEIPGKIPACGFRVRDEWRSWEEGKLMVFVDAVIHEAINLSDRNRFIFSIDVIRPEFRNKRNFICSVVMTSMFLQNRAEGLRFLYKLPLTVQNIIGTLLVPFAFMAIRVRNFLHFIKYK